MCLVLPLSKSSTATYGCIQCGLVGIACRVEWLDRLVCFCYHWWRLSVHFFPAHVQHTLVHGKLPSSCLERLANLVDWLWTLPDSRLFKFDKPQINKFIYAFIIIIKSAKNNWHFQGLFENISADWYSAIPDHIGFQFNIKKHKGGKYIIRTEGDIWFPEACI